MDGDDQGEFDDGKKRIAETRRDFEAEGSDGLFAEQWSWVVWGVVGS